MVDVGDDGKVANVLHTGAMGVGKEGYCSGSRGLHVQRKRLLQRMSVQRQGNVPAMRPHQRNGPHWAARRVRVAQAPPLPSARGGRLSPMPYWGRTGT